MTTQSVGWTPSALRSAAVAAAPPLRGATVAQLPLQWGSKASSEVLDYRLDLTDWLVDAGDAVVRVLSAWVAPQASPVDLEILWTTVFSGSPLLLLGGGVPGTAYTVGVEVKLSSGRIAAFAADLLITALTPAAPAPNAPAALLPDLVPLATPLGPLLLGAEPLLVPAGTSGTLSAPMPIPPNGIAVPDGILVLDDGSPLLLA